MGLCLLFFQTSEYMKIKRLTDMKEFFTKSGVKWPELEWINVDGILHDSTLPEVPAGCRAHRV